MGLDAVTRLRFSQSWLVYLLPLMGLAMGFYYRYNGQEAKAATREIFSKYQDKERKIPLSMVPSLFLSCSLTHLVGGSVGRAGSAVQIGAVLSSSFHRILGNDDRTNRLLIACGMSAGFAAVFGTPWAGAVFAHQILGNRIFSKQIIFCLFTALVADAVCCAWGADLIPYPKVNFDLALSSWPLLFLKILFLGLAASLVGRFYLKSNQQLSKSFQKYIPHEGIRAAVGGGVILVLFLALGTSDYLGLGILPEHSHSITLPNLFSADTQVPWNAWLWKVIFTSITLSAGFKGGEIAPILFIGAALGNSVAWLLGAPIDLFALIAMFAVFAATTKAHFAAVIMAVEIFGLSIALPAALGIFLACKFSGKDSIYPAIPRST